MMRKGRGGYCLLC